MWKAQRIKQNRPAAEEADGAKGEEGEHQKTKAELRAERRAEEAEAQLRDDEAKAAERAAFDAQQEEYIQNKIETVKQQKSERQLLELERARCLEEEKTKEAERIRLEEETKASAEYSLVELNEKKREDIRRIEDEDLERERADKQRVIEEAEEEEERRIEAERRAERDAKARITIKMAEPFEPYKKSTLKMQPRSRTVNVQTVHRQELTENQKRATASFLSADTCTLVDAEVVEYINTWTPEVVTLVENLLIAAKGDCMKILKDFIRVGRTFKDLPELAKGLYQSVTTAPAEYSRVTKYLAHLLPAITIDYPTLDHLIFTCGGTKGTVLVSKYTLLPTTLLPRTDLTETTE